MLKYEIKYECSRCRAQGIKLWRLYKVSLDQQTLLCRTCAEKEQKTPQNAWDAERRYPNSDTIGQRIPAVPTVEGDTFWEYASEPYSRMEWWRGLPET